MDAVVTKTCTKCGETKPLSSFRRRRLKPGAYTAPLENHCRKCLSAYLVKWNREHPEKSRKAHTAWHARNPEARVWGNLQKRASKLGLPCTVTREEVARLMRETTVCPVLGITLERGSGKHAPNSPSIDRRIPALGYVPGNVAIISNRANTLKRDATLDELRALVAWMERGQPL